MAALAAASVVQRADAAPKKLEGRLEVSVIDGPTSAAYEYAVVTRDKKRIKLKLSKRPRIEPGAEVRVSGDLAADTLAVDAIEQTAPAPDAPEAGRRRILVMLVQWTAPDAMTSARAQNVFGPQDDAWFNDVSFGKVRTEATATPWMRITPSTCAQPEAMLVRAQEAARQLGYEPAAYDHQVVYFPREDACWWAGWANVRGPNIWLNGFLDLRITTHELGHNLGIWHANTLDCSDGAGRQVTLTAQSEGCLDDEYGDPFDAMGGSSLVGHYSAAHKHALGWIEGRVQTVTGDTTVTLAPLESSGGGSAGAVIRTPARDYWLEYRRPIGTDAFLTGYPEATDGVLIHVDDARDDVYLLDARPDANRWFTDPALPAGSSWTTPEGITIRVDAATGTEARVTVRMPATSNLVRNPSFESDLSGWGSFGGTLTRVAVADAPDGAYAVRAAWQTGNLFTVSDTQGTAKPTVASTEAGATYVATAYVKAATTSSAGKPVQIILRELTPAGATVRETITHATLSSAFARIGVSATAVASGNTMGVRVVQASAGSGDAFLADLITLRKASVVMGRSDPGTVRTALSRNMKRASRFAFAAPGTVDVAQIRAYIDGAAATSGSQPVRAVLYRDAAGAPGQLVARTNELSVAARRPAGWAALGFPAPVRLTAGAYWVGLHSGGTTVVARYAGDTVSGALRFNADAYGDGSASPFGAASSDDVEGAFQVIGG